MKKQRVRDKFWFEDHPKNDIDRIEISLPSESVDIFLKDFVAPEEDTSRSKEKKERLIRKIFKSASEILTDRQFQIFVMRHVFGQKQDLIAKLVSCDQSYVAAVLKASNKKIRIALRLEQKTRKGVQCSEKTRKAATHP